MATPQSFDRRARPILNTLLGWLHWPVALLAGSLPLLSAPRTLWLVASISLGGVFLALTPLLTHQRCLKTLSRLRRLRHWCWLLGGVGVMGAITLLIYVPDPAHLASRVFQTDGFHHWDPYAVAPALAYGHGAALGTDVYCQYGVGWPLLLAALSCFRPLAYKLAIEMGVLWACLYFTALFLFLWDLLRSRRWAICGVLLAVFLQMFCGTEVPLWVSPSSTVMRSAMDVFFWSCLRHARGGDDRYAYLTGAIVAAAMLFGLDTGLYLLVCHGAYCPALWRLQTDPERQPRLRGYALRSGATLLATLLLGLVMASRGTLLHGGFWTRLARIPAGVQERVDPPSHQRVAFGGDVLSGAALDVGLLPGGGRADAQGARPQGDRARIVGSGHGRPLRICGPAALHWPFTPV